MEYGTLTANGDTDVVAVLGPFWVHVRGTWGSGTFIITYKYPDGTYETLEGGSFTANFDKFVKAPENVITYIKGTLSGATGPILKWNIRGRGA